MAEQEQSPAVEEACNEKNMDCDDGDGEGSAVNCEGEDGDEESSENSGLELQLRPLKVQVCKTCVEFKLERDFLFKKCQNYERQLAELNRERAETKTLMSKTQSAIDRLNNMLNPTKDNSDNSGPSNDDNEDERPGPQANEFVEVLVKTEPEDFVEESGDDGDQNQIDEEPSEILSDPNFGLGERSANARSGKKFTEFICKWITVDEDGIHNKCNTVRGFLDDIVVHVLTSHVEPDGSSFQCCWEGCERNGEPMRSKNTFAEHLRIHNGENPYRCQVEGCGKVLMDCEAFAAHQTVHADGGPSAPKISRIGTDPVAFSMTLENPNVVPAVDKQITCTFERCEEEFSSVTEYKIHMATHTGDAQLECDICSRKYNTPSSFRQHMATHRMLLPKVPFIPVVVNSAKT